MSNAVEKEDFKPDPKVQVLDDLVVNQIAAGEVVERPASVVKELIENSVDSGASRIVVGVVTGGRSRITVKDDGCGMSPENALTAIRRFGTSKISRTTDLLEISSMGFRGEALPSIAAVSKFSLRSQAEGADGVSIVIAGGVQESVDYGKQVSGTTIAVEDLFYNVPARKKFLKTEKTELGYIKAVIQDIACANPGIRFELVSEGKTLLTLAAASSFFERAGQVLKNTSDFVEIRDVLNTDSGDYQVEGLVGKPLNSTRGATKLRLLVNGRAVRDKLMLRAVREGYGNMLKPGQYPVGVVRLLIPPLDLDINVHPQKSEVRFRFSSEVFKVIARSIKRAISDEKTGFYGGVSLRESFSDQGRVVSFNRSEAPSEAPRFFESGYLESTTLEAETVAKSADPVSDIPVQNGSQQSEPEVLPVVRRKRSFRHTGYACSA